MFMVDFLVPQPASVTDITQGKCFILRTQTCHCQVLTKGILLFQVFSSQWVRLEQQLMPQKGFKTNLWMFSPGLGLHLPGGNASSIPPDVLPVV